MTHQPTLPLTAGLRAFVGDASGWRRWTLGLFEPSQTSLLSPAADVLMAGGASLLLFLLLQVLEASGLRSGTWTGAVYYASFLVNYPHFSASYQLLYRDAARDFFAFGSRPFFALKLWWAGLVVPLLLLAYLACALSAGSTVLMGYAVNAMYFLVGWHYVKQVFGCVIVLSAAKRVFYVRWERWAILGSLYSLWLLSYAAVNTQPRVELFLGIPYSSLQLPTAVCWLLWGCCGMTTAGLLALFGRRLLQRRAMPPLSAIVALVAIYVWLIPVYSSTDYSAMIPFFHSLQYLLFVLAYKRNQSIHGVGSSGTGTEGAKSESRRAKARAARRMTVLAAIMFLVVPGLLLAASPGWFSGTFEEMLNETYGMLLMVSSSLWLRTVAIAAALGVCLALLRWAARRNPLWQFLLFAVQILFLGALLFSLAPTLLDILARNALLPAWLADRTAAFGASFYLFAFFIFINIHHYFVDNVLWRRDNPHVRQYLFGKPA